MRRKTIQVILKAVDQERNSGPGKLQRKEKSQEIVGFWETTCT
jgi:hypothetical protein